MTIKNLLQETITELEIKGKTPANVRWVGSLDGKYAIDWETFAGLADFEYDAGYGRAEVVCDLTVVGDDWWLERYGYDGNEYWDYNTLPIKRPNAQPIKRVKLAPDDHGWSTIWDANSLNYERDYPAIPSR